jgi:O-methyltransferase involved in polyketide biosynthesis
MGRATAHARSNAPRFQDPTALTLLPDGARKRVERFLRGETHGLRERVGRFALAWQSRVMVARTVAIDDAVREAKAPQLVILGAKEDIEKSLAVIAKRSAPASRLIVLYITERLMRRLVNIVVSRMGEPFRSVFTVEEMRALLSKHGFGIVRDQAIPEVALDLGDEIFRVARRAKHLRVVSADRS